jgi:xylulokinase
MTRAVIEGVCFAMRDSLTILQELHLAPTSLLLTGGGARSGLLRQLQADIYGMPITTVNLEEGPAYGAALLAAVGVGAFRDIATAARATLTRAPVEAPTVGAHEQYEHAYARYRAAYGALRPVMQMP